MAPREGAGAVVVELRGGRGAFVPRAVARRMVTSISPEDAVLRPSGPAGWLERLQAARSAVLVVPDRPTGVAIALRWRLDPQRFRLSSEFDPARLAAGVEADPAAWHSAR